MSRGSTAPDVQAEDKESPENCIACEVSAVISPDFSYILVARRRVAKNYSEAVLFVAQGALLCASPLQWPEKKRLNFFGRGPLSLPPRKKCSHLRDAA